MQPGCIICLDPLEGDKIKIVTTKCGHCFHYVCIEEWLKRSGTCPECRNEVSEHFLTKLHIKFCIDNLSDKNAEEHMLVLEKQLCEKDLECMEKDKKIEGVQMHHAQLVRENVEKEEKIRNLQKQLHDKDLECVRKDTDNAFFQMYQAQLERENVEKEGKIKELIFKAADHEKCSKQKIEFQNEINALKNKVKDEKEVEVMLQLGHTAVDRDTPTKEGHTHDWQVFVRGPDESAIGNLIEKVVFHLHESYPIHKRVIKQPPFQISDSGYASFTVNIDVYFRTKEEPKKVSYIYDLYMRLGEAVDNIRREKLIFQNPGEEFIEKLLYIGGVRWAKGDDSSSHNGIRFNQNRKKENSHRDLSVICDKTVKLDSSKNNAFLDWVDGSKLCSKRKNLESEQNKKKERNQKLLLHPWCMNSFYRDASSHNGIQFIGSLKKENSQRNLSVICDKTAKLDSSKNNAFLNWADKVDGFKLCSKRKSPE